MTGVFSVKDGNKELIAELNKTLEHDHRDYDSGGTDRKSVV